MRVPPRYLKHKISLISIASRLQISKFSTVLYILLRSVSYISSFKLFGGTIKRARSFRIRKRLHHLNHQYFDRACVDLATPLATHWTSRCRSEIMSTVSTTPVVIVEQEKEPQNVSEKIIDTILAKSTKPWISVEFFPPKTEIGSL